MRILLYFGAKINFLDFPFDQVVRFSAFWEIWRTKLERVMLLT
jgi:hypothetical protein